MKIRIGMNSAIARTFIALIILQIAVITANANGAGNLDLTFAGTGYVRGAELPLDWASDVVVQADGKIVIIAHNNLSSRMYLARFHPNGTFDASFGNGGILYPGDLFGRPTLSADFLLLQPDGKILIQGIIRLNSDGTVDTTFAGDGWADVRYGEYPGGVEQAAIGPDGKITVQGRFVDPRFGAQYAGTARFNSDGSPDTTFGVNGSRILFHPGVDFSILPDGKMIAGSGSLTVIRRNSDGSLDTTYNGTGTSQEPPLPGSSQVREVLLLPDSKVIVAGSVNDGDITNFGVVRYNSDGSLDTTFNGTGLVINTEIPGPFVSGLSIQTDGKIVVCIASAQNIALVRYNIDGSLDATYGSNGIAVIDLGFNERNLAMTLDGSNRAMVVGGSQTPFVARITSEATQPADITGRTVTAAGVPVSGATVILTNAQGQSQYTLSSHFGYFSFTGVSSNEVYTVRVSKKRYRFQPISQTITLFDSISGLDFVGNTSSDTLLEEKGKGPEK